MLAFAIAFTVVLNLSLLQRRFGPLERLVDEMERADLTRPGANLRQAAEPGWAGGGRAPAPRLHPDARAPGGRAPAGVERRARGPGGGTRPGRTRPSRRGQPVPDRLVAAARGGSREGAAAARRRARRDQDAREPGHAGAAHARPPAAPDGARRPRPRGGARRQRAGDLPPGPPGDLRGGSASWGASRATRSSSSTGWPRRRSRTPFGTRAPSTSASGSAAATGGSSCGSPTTAADSASTTPAAASGSAACASARSSSAGTFRSNPGLRWAQGFGSSCR